MLPCISTLCPGCRLPATRLSFHCPGISAARATTSLLQKANSGKNAHHTTREEFTDNLYFIMKKWNEKTQNAPFLLSYDNAKIQATADISTLYHPDHPGEEEHAIHIDPEVSKLPLPAYSHDLNRPIEHIFGTMKHKIREALYFEYHKYNTARNLQTLVWDKFHNFIPKGQVEKDVRGLPYLWEVLSTGAGITFVRDDGSEAVGTGGNWTNAYMR